ncbi:MAG: hypothetical protein M1839_006044 [Geoglossum umbratile]|nr:MAG: hypothetical protein M1839_006044 [Geoglossum umbratile]
MVQKVTTAKSIVALLYLITAAGPALALPVAGPAKLRDEHGITERDVLPGGSAPHLLELVNRELADNFGGIIGKDTEPVMEARDPDVRRDVVTKREPDMEDPEIEAREPSVRHNGVTKREPGAEPEPCRACKRSAEPSPEINPVTP